MVRFLFGRAVSGKTTTILNMIKEDVDCGQRDVVLLVPEQASFDYERSLLRILGDGRYTAVPVLSFTRLLDEVGRNCGGISGKHLTDSGRIILMSRAMKAVEDNLSLFSKYSSNTSFINSVIDVIGEFKRCGITSDEVRLFATRSKGALSQKLCDLALLYDAYDGVIKNQYIDVSDDMLRLGSMLSQYAYFSEKTVYIDSFKNFTGSQIKVIEHIIRQADEVVFSFCFDGERNKAGLFSNVLKTVNELERLAKKHGVSVEKPVILDKNYYSNEALAALESALCGKEREIYSYDCEQITLCEAESVYDETEFAANEIRRLVRSGKYRYRDFVVICRDDEKYRQAFLNTCERYSVPCFKDKRHTISHTPLPVFLLSALKACRTLSSEDILRYLKTELAGLSFDEVSLLENYVYVWRIERDDWKKEWNMSPSGFDGFSDEDKEQLDLLQQLRVRAITPLLNLRSRLGDCAEQMTNALWRLMEDCSVGEKLPLLCGDNSELEIISGSYDAVVEILDALNDTLGDAFCTIEQFEEYFEIALSSAEVGSIPQMLDEVTFGAADRIKPKEPKVVFVLGLNQGVFPATANAGGIIGGNERIKLLRLGMPITDYTLGFSIDEEYLLYTTLCAASDRVYACYHTVDDSGKEAKPSVVIENIARLFQNCRKITFGKDSFSYDRIETPRAAFTGLMRNYDGELSLSLKAVFSAGEYKDRLNQIERLRSEKEDELSCGMGEKLYGKNMYLSATAINTYFTCNFSYFCKYGLHAKTINPAEINTLQRGTMVHEVLEKTIEKYGKDICTLSDEQIKAEAENTIEEYLAAIQGIEQVADARMEYIVKSIKKLSVAILCHMRDEFAQSGFEPVKCELKIGGEDGDIEAAVIKTPDGSIKLRGAIDRVDTYGAYIRVVDYKTGTRKFALSDVLYGLNMQMLLYLYAALKSQKYKDFAPAGVLYLEANSKVGDTAPFIMNGIINDKENVRTAMEADNEGKYIPQISFNKDGSVSKRSNSFIDEELFYDTFNHMERLLVKMNRELLEGKMPVNPRDTGNKDACTYCDFASVCGIENRSHQKSPKRANGELSEIFKGGDGNV